MQNKRRFTRVIFSTPALLIVDGKSFKTSLVDLSLKGALVNNDNDLTTHKGASCSLSFQLNGSDVAIDILGKITHIEDKSIGIECTKIDLESVSHLKRLIALNIGDEDMLDRELTSLTHPIHT